MVDARTPAEPGVVVVTGASRGIGAAVALRAAAQGYAVAVSFLTDEAAAQGVVRHIASSGGRARAIQGDVACEDDVLRLFQTADRELGPLKALVNNAGVTGGFARVEAVTLDVVTRVLAVNVIGTMLCSRVELCSGFTDHR